MNITGPEQLSTYLRELIGAQDPIADRAEFMRAQVLFWLIGATDGHAKNFSIFIEAGNQYRHTPLYDIISAYPAISRKGLHERDLKLAMSLKGSSGRKYQCMMIRTKHFLATAKGQKKAHTT